MSEAGEFKYEGCLLKHYVRVKGWLPNCRDRKRAINAGVPERRKRRLRYFTFCAIGAIDVLMLDIVRVIVKSQTDKFDNVVFFDRDGDSVSKTQLNIPGAIGFPGSFTQVVLAGGTEPDVAMASDLLKAPENLEDTKETRVRQGLQFQHEAFRAQFPFDVINLDLEEFAFKHRDPFPGQVINSIRRIAAWQKQPLRVQNGSRVKEVVLDSFTLMFTTQIGPPNIAPEYVAMLRTCLDQNVQDRPTLLDLLRTRFGIDEIEHLQGKRFPEFFKLGIRKILADIFMEMDWYVDPDKGIKTFEFQRQSLSGPYTMLHFVMDVRRQKPPIAQRAPNTSPQEVVAAYASVVDALFSTPEFEVTDEVAQGTKLYPTLDQIRARRKMYNRDAS